MILATNTCSATETPQAAITSAAFLATVPPVSGRWRNALGSITSKTTIPEITGTRFRLMSDCPSSTERVNREVVCLFLVSLLQTFSCNLRSVCRGRFGFHSYTRAFPGHSLLYRKLH